MTMFVLSYPTFASIASLASVAAKPAARTPILESIYLTVRSDGSWLAIATDRYVAARVDSDSDKKYWANESPDSEIKLLLNAKEVSALSKQNRQRLAVTFTVAGDDVTLTIGATSVTLRGSAYAGSYPNVASFFAKHVEASEVFPLTFNPASLAAVASVHVPEYFTLQSARDRMNSSALTLVSGSDKKRPVRVSRPKCAGFEALLMPISPTAG